MERSFYPFAPPLAFIRLSIRFGRDTIFLFLVDQKSKDNFWPEKLRICHTSVSPISHGSLFVFSDIQCKSNVCASSLQSDSFLKKISCVCLLLRLRQVWGSCTGGFFGGECGTQGQNTKKNFTLFIAVHCNATAYCWDIVFKQFNSVHYKKSDGLCILCKNGLGHIVLVWGMMSQWMQQEE